MTAPDSTKLLHDLKSKCASLRNAADLLKDCSPAEKKEMLALMTMAAAEIVKITGELGKTV